MNKIFLFFLIILSACTIFSQEKSGVLVIDNKLNNYFFDNPPIVAQEGSQRVYIDGVIVDSSESVNNWNVIINSDIRDLNRNHYSFDTCISLFIEDTLIIKFRNRSKITDNGLLLKIINGKYYAYYMNFLENKSDIAKPISLKFKNAINKKNKKIFGEMEVSFSDSILNKEYLFKGPFYCVVER